MDAECVCLRPYFPSKSGDLACVSAFENFGTTWMAPVVIFEVGFMLYNIIYATWVVRNKALNDCKEPGCTCNTAVAGACCIFTMEVLRLASVIVDPFYIVESMPNRVGFILFDSSIALLKIVMLLVFLPYADAVALDIQSRRRDDVDAMHRKWNAAKLITVTFTAVAAIVTLAREWVVLLAGKHMEGFLYIVFNVLDAIFFLCFITLLTIFIRMLELRIEEITKRSRLPEEATHQLQRMLTAMTRYFYPATACGVVILFFFIAYSLCLADLAPLSWILSWVFMHLLVSVLSLLLLFASEGRPVSEFPSCVCRMCRKEKKAKKAYPYKVSISRQTSATNDYLNGVELRAVDVVKPVNVL